MIDETLSSQDATHAYGLHIALREAAVCVGQAHVDDFPGLLEFVQDKLGPVVGRPARNAHGWFAPETCCKLCDSPFIQHSPPAQEVGPAQNRRD